MARALTFAFMLTCLIVVTSRHARAEDAVTKDAAKLESRISNLEDKLESIEAKLDGTVQFLDKQTADRGHADQAVGAKQSSSASEDKATSADDKQADSQSSSDNKKPEDILTLEVRAAKIESAIAKIEKHLSKLDDIAERLDQKRSRKDLVEVSGRVKKQGTVFINNWTGDTHLVSINGTQYFIQPGRTRVGTEYGELTTQLPWFETPNKWKASHWKMVGDEYQITLDLRNPN
jgi:hypothetical protein